MFSYSLDQLNRYEKIFNEFSVVCNACFVGLFVNLFFS